MMTNPNQEPLPRRRQDSEAPLQSPFIEGVMPEKSPASQDASNAGVPIAGASQPSEPWAPWRPSAGVQPAGGIPMPPSEPPTYPAGSAVPPRTEEAASYPYVSPYGEAQTQPGASFPPYDGVPASGTNADAWQPTQDASAYTGAPGGGYGWGSPAEPGFASGLGSEDGQGPRGPRGKDRERKKRPFLMVGTTAIVAALLASGGTAYLTGAFDSDSQVHQGSGAYRELGSSSTGNKVPVSGSTSQNPDWEKVAAAVRESVVAIQVSTGESSGGQGSGVIVNAKEGQIVTNNHVVAGAKKIQVVLADGRVFDANVVGTDPTTDLAVIKLVNPPDNLKEAKLGDSAKVTIGQSVMAVGNPLGLDNTVTTGIVSAINRPVSTVADEQSQPVVSNALQIDAAINPGNSGGPLFNASGEVVGINSSIASMSDSSGSSSQAGSIGLGFAIPSNQVNNIAAQLIESGKAAHPQIGVQVASTPAEVEVDGVSRRGAQIVGITGKAAKSAGLKDGDVIVSVNGQPTASSNSVIAWIRSFTVGDKVKLTVVSKNGEAKEVEMTLEKAQDAGRTYTPRQEPDDSGNQIPEE